ncbi:peptide-methionine (S)-S-oxide reductase MsrA [Caenispirillum salinarum]|uniref:peptide-methionine (S)-S-oxide reductase MsrA n=1 Tax=Caenispirillum salinarum TaxID=859058 RepID=UPI00384BA9BC
MAVATFAAGCFWGVEEAFRRTPGVISTMVGYTGGNRPDPTYEQVCSGETGHAEAVRVDYDPETISYEDLLDVFWKAHDPTQKDRQGFDVGSQYRSAIFVHDDMQREKAGTSLRQNEESGRFPRPIVTEITEAGTFYPAEDYHQQYMAKRGRGTTVCGMPGRW